MESYSRQVHNYALLNNATQDEVMPFTYSRAQPAMTPNAKAPVCRSYGSGGGSLSGRRGVWTE